MAVLLLALSSACGPESSPSEQTRDALTGTWQPLGNGVTLLDTGNVLGSSVFIGYAGYNISLGESQAWVGALYDERLEHLGVRYLVAVQGPQDPGYNALEIGNSRIVAALGTLVTAQTNFILVAGHSSGSFVADEFLHQLPGADPYGVFGAKTVFFNLDGDQKYVTSSDLTRLRRVYFVNAFDPVTGVASWNHGAMSSLGSAFAAQGGTLQYDASSSGCVAGGCVHISLINTVPHDPASGSGVDYDDFGGRGVNAWWLDAKQAEAGLGQCNTPHVTEGLIEARYEALGGCASALGSPTSPMLPTASGAGRFSTFEFGAIYWSFFTGAHEVRGAIHADWAALQYENGPLGYPTSDELTTFDTVGRYNRFEHGAVYWSFGTGAHAVVEPAYSAWAQRGFENGALGYPTSDTHAAGCGVETRFQHGLLSVCTDGQVSVQLDGSPTLDAGAPPSSEPLTDAGVPEVPAAVPFENADVQEVRLTTPLGGVVGGCSTSGASMLLGLAGLWLRGARRRRA